MTTKIIWKTNEEMNEALNKRIKEWKDGYSKDGYIQAGEGEFVYRGIKYLIRVLRYYNHTDKFISMSSRISDKHVVVEYPEETKPIVNLVQQAVEFSEFLYHDTLHSWNDNQTCEEQIEECHRLAKEDIDNLLDGDYIKIVEKKIADLQEVIKKLKQVS